MLNDQWFDRLERRLGFLSIPGLAGFIVGMNAAVWALSLMRPEFPFALNLVPELVLRGQVWRAFTFLFIPPASGPLWTILWLGVLYTYSVALEREWGDFRFTLFYGLGAATTVAASLTLGLPLGNVPLNTSLFLAFAALYPDFELLLFFVLPVKARWLAAVAWIGVAWNVLMGGFPARVAWSAGLLNYLLFFGGEHGRALQRAWRRRHGR